MTEDGAHTGLNLRLRSLVRSSIDSCRNEKGIQFTEREHVPSIRTDIEFEYRTQ